MISYKDKTFCASPKCENKCGRKLTMEQKMEVHRNKIDVCYAYFCGEPGDDLFSDEHKQKEDEE